MEVEIKRLRLRSWRRGMRELDLILGRFADAALGEFGEEERRLYARLLAEDDHDLYAWIAGARPPPPSLATMVARLRAFHGMTGA